MFYLNLIFSDIPKLALKLGSSFFHSLFLYFRFIFFLIHKKIQKNDSSWLFNFEFNKSAFHIYLFEGSPDIAALKEIFIDGEYSWSNIKDPQVIIDLGAHTGNTALYFSLIYPNAVIYAVEASPKSFKRLLVNVENNRNIRPIFGAVSDSDGVMTFYESESSLGSSIYARHDMATKIEVPSFTLRTLMDKNGIKKADFIKVDIEGSEEKLFTTVSPKEFSISYIIEVHGDLLRMDSDFAEKFFSGFTTTKRPLKIHSRYLLYAQQT